MQLRGDVLITGGSGTLGRAIATAAREHGWPCRLTIFSRSEFLQARMRERFPNLRYVLGDVRDAAAVDAAIAGHEVVIHAAAMKRIPECEEHVLECWQTNVQGSVNVAKACVRHNVRRAVAISTDKAARAVTVYGASKLAMEGLWRSQQLPGCTFTLVRYGNVMASRGSVIERWEQQLAAGQTLTVTDKRMTRFWMSPKDAVELVARALEIAHGQILIPRMKALSLEAMIGMIAPKAPFEEVGLRSLEKLHEDLIHPDEKVTDQNGFFLVGNRSGRKGLSFTSKTAEPLSLEELEAMLADAAQLEW